jgi:hypothetical protein
LKQTPTPNVDLSRYVATREWAVAADGTRVPLDIVRHVDTAADGTAPAMVYGYGSYEASMPPWFSVARISLLDRGWVWALVHPRGGGELGRRWYTQGRLLHKRNTFTDTISSVDTWSQRAARSAARHAVGLRSWAADPATRALQRHRRRGALRRRGHHVDPAPAHHHRMGRMGRPQRTVAVIVVLPYDNVTPRLSGMSSLPVSTIRESASRAGQVVVAAPSAPAWALVLRPRWARATARAGGTTVGGKR